MVRMSDALGMRRAGADVEIDEFGRLIETIWVGFRSVNSPGDFSP
jgi:hypothetical protein